MHRSALVVFTLLVLAGASDVRAQPYRQILQNQLDAAETVVKNNGYRVDPTAYRTDMIAGFLDDGAAVGLELQLLEGRGYTIVGVCDQDCGDLDLALATVSGDVLYEDELEDDAPVLEFTAPAGDHFMLLVRMYDCSVEPCGFAYKVYRK